MSKLKRWRVSIREREDVVLRAESMIITGGALIATGPCTSNEGKQATLGAWAPGCWTQVEQIDEAGNTLSRL